MENLEEKPWGASVTITAERLIFSELIKSSQK